MTKRKISFSDSSKFNKNSSKFGKVFVKGDLKVSRIIINAVNEIIPTIKYDKILLKLSVFDLIFSLYFASSNISSIFSSSTILSIFPSSTISSIFSPFSIF